MGAAITLKRTLNNGLAKIPLFVMLDAAREAGVRFNDIDDPEQAVPDELQSYLTKALALSKTARYGGESTAFTQAEIEEIGGEYIHCSANWNSVVLSDKGNITSAVKASELISFVNRPCKDWKRTIYDINGKDISS